MVSKTTRVSISRPLYLILEANPVISADLQGAVLEVEPDARVLSFDAITEAQQALVELRHLQVAILGMPASSIIASDFLDELTQRGAAIVVTGEYDMADPVQQTRLHVLQRPFSTEVVHDCLRAIKAGGQICVQ